MVPISEPAIDDGRHNGVDTIAPVISIESRESVLNAVDGVPILVGVEIGVTFFRRAVIEASQNRCRAPMAFLVDDLLLLLLLCSSTEDITGIFLVSTIMQWTGCGAKSVEREIDAAVVGESAVVAKALEKIEC